MKLPVSTEAPGCSSSVYNIHMEFECQEECRSSSTSVCGLEGVHLPGIELPRCPDDQTESITVNPDRKKKKKMKKEVAEDEASTESVAEVRDRLQEMARDAYLARLGAFYKSTEPDHESATRLPFQVAALYKRFLEEHNRDNRDSET